MSNNKSTTKRFAPKLHVRTDDEVIVLSGDNKGKQGRVLQVFPDKMRATVEGINIVKKHVKATQNQEGGIQEMEAPLHISNLAIVDPVSGKPTRIGRRSENGTNVRYAKKSGKTI
jgi:large subunit ribosomal protein L24